MDVSKLFEPGEIRHLSKDETIALYKRHMLAQHERAERLQQALDDLDELAQYWLLADTYDGREAGHARRGSVIVDKDLATWRRVTEQGERAMDELVWTVLNVNWRASADRVEAELSRLREQRDYDVWNERILRRAAEARCAELEQERDAAMDAVGLPRTASLDDLIRHHRGNAATAAGFDQIAAEAECARLQQALEAARREAGRVQDVRANRTRIIGNIALIADEALAGPDTPADSHYRERPIEEDFYLDPRGEWVYRWSDERRVLKPADSQEDKT